MENRTIEIKLTHAEILALLERRPRYNKDDLTAIQKLNVGYSQLAEKKRLERQSGENNHD